MLILILTLLPLALVSVFAKTFASDLPCLDQWSFIPLLEKAYEGNLGFPDFWLPYNGHRLVFPKLVMLGLALPTRWNIHFELAASLSLTAALGAVLFFQLRRTQAFHGAKNPLPYGVLAGFVFSLNQYENWQIGFYMQHFMNALFAAIGFGLLCSGKLDEKKIALAAAAGLAATFSTGSGALFWPVGLAVLFWRPDVPGKTKTAWALFGATVLGLYFWDYPLPPSPPFDFHRALLRTGFLLAYLGAPWISVLIESHAARVWAAMSIGLAGLALFILTGRALRREPATLFWPALALYSIGSGAAIAMARAYAFGIYPATSSRYMTSANLFWIGLFMSLVILGREKKRRAARFQGAALALFFLLQALIARGAWDYARAYKAVTVQARESLRAERYGDEAVRYVCPWLDPRPLAAVLKKFRLAGFG